MNLSEIQSKSTSELHVLAQDIGVNVEGASNKRHDLLAKILSIYAEKDDSVKAKGVLSVSKDGYGFLRTYSAGNTSIGSNGSSSDVYVSQSQIRKHSLRPGDMILGAVRAPKDGERYFGLVNVDTINDVNTSSLQNRQYFERLTPLHPEEMIKMEIGQKRLSNRVIDLVSPIGRGQRGLIVAPPKAGKTTFLKDMAEGITQNAPDIHLMVALIGERPEEVTDMTRSVNGEVYSSTFDEPVEDHCKVAELVLERAKRLVESGKDVAILLDSITRMTRAYNLSAPTSGRTLSGGIDPVAFYPSKKFFGAARNAEDGGSLTILAACLVDTGSRMDDVIYEEFKGTGNMEIHLDRRLSERRVYPAIDIAKSGTRREELMLSPETLKQTWLLRRMISLMNSQSNHDSKTSVDVVEQIFNRLKATKTNQEFLDKLNRDASAKSAK